MRMPAVVCTDGEENFRICVKIRGGLGAVPEYVLELEDGRDALGTLRWKRPTDYRSCSGVPDRLARAFEELVARSWKEFPAWLWQWADDELSLEDHRHVPRWLARAIELKKKSEISRAHGLVEGRREKT